MRRLSPACLTALALAAATGARAEGPPAGPAQDRGVLQAQPGFRDALTAPLEDLNLKRTAVPDVLARARANPYAPDGLDRCEAIAGEVGRLDAVLGPDAAEPPPPGEAKKPGAGAQIHAVAVEAAQDQAHGLIPVRSWIRRLTGAEHRARTLAAAVNAGNVRRGYLKGVGMRMNCAPPAAPSWFVPAKPVVAKAAAARAAAAKAEAPAWERVWRSLVAWIATMIAAARSILARF